MFKKHNAPSDAPPPMPQAPPPAYQSRAPPQYTNRFAALLLSGYDRIRLIGFPPEMNNTILGIVRHAWPTGIQECGDNHGGFEVKLRGYPWQDGFEQGIPARRLMMHILFGFAGQGWHLHFAADLARKARDKDTLFFQLGAPIQRSVFSVYFRHGDKVVIIDPPTEAVKASLTAVVREWPEGVQQEKPKGPGCHQLKLRGNPWMTSWGEEVSMARMLNLNILSAMDALGYELVASIDMTQGSGDHPTDIDTWFFMSKI